MDLSGLGNVAADLEKVISYAPMKKIAGVSLWTWMFGVVVMTALVWITAPMVRATYAEKTKPVPLEIVKQELWKQFGSYHVSGQVFNPRKDPARNIEIRYKVWKSALVETGIQKVEMGEVTAKINYLPAKGTVDFSTAGIGVVGEYDVPGMEGRIVEAPPEKR